MSFTNFHASSGSPWSESYDPDNFIARNVRISFRLHDPSANPHPSKFLSVPAYKCLVNKKAELPQSLSSRTALNFTTTVATNLKIVFLGDSLSQQVSQAFDASILDDNHEKHRHVLKEFRNGPDSVNSHNCLSITAPTRGGGVSAYWRVSNLVLNVNEKGNVSM